MNSIAGKAVIVCGPTSVGKTALAIELCRRFNGEIIAADSRQVYRGMDVGTGKIPHGASWQKSNGLWLIEGVAVHLYDVCDPKDQFNVADFVRLANLVLKKLWQEQKLPLVVGGTGFYIKALVDGVEFLGVAPDPQLRRRLAGNTKGQLQQELQRLDPARYQQMTPSDRQNPRRLIRAIEIFHSGKRDKNPKQPLLITDAIWLGLTAQRELLYERIDQWVEEALGQGLLEEGQRLIDGGLSIARLEEFGLIYRQVAEYIKGRLTYQQLVDRLKFSLHDYARRQLTVFSRDKRITWFDIAGKQLIEQVAAQVTKWYNT